MVTLPLNSGSWATAIWLWATGELSTRALWPSVLTVPITTGRVLAQAHFLFLGGFDAQRCRWRTPCRSQLDIAPGTLDDQDRCVKLFFHGDTEAVFRVNPGVAPTLSDGKRAAGHTYSLFMAGINLYCILFIRIGRRINLTREMIRALEFIPVKRIFVFCKIFRRIDFIHNILHDMIDRPGSSCALLCR